MINKDTLLTHDNLHIESDMKAIFIWSNNKVAYCSDFVIYTINYRGGQKYVFNKCYKPNLCL
ncbi:hypothetical protein B0P06_000005 [Clostridium saccharoperbutylacetonicum]|nr:hypothetical protein [Clostridium saccharoperbutylacetonicum]